MSDLIAEARYFQSKRVLNTRQMIINREQNPAIAAKLVRKSMIGKAARLLQGKNARREILSVSDIVEDKTVKERSNTLHPNASKFYKDCVLKHPQKNRAEHHEARFLELTKEHIIWAAKSTKGSAGLSGTEAFSWNSMLTYFGQ
ncbi:hypothetical protein GJ496_010121 [Pomphorhynchus laevis]|nr:hypothetical protein GJ496_010121 [Pomphorhynchus laevis]